MSTSPHVPTPEDLAAPWSAAPDALARIAARTGDTIDTDATTEALTDDPNTGDPEPAASAMRHEFADALLGSEPHQEAARAALADSLRTAAEEGGQTVGQELARLDDLTPTPPCLPDQPGHRAAARPGPGGSGTAPAKSLEDEGGEQREYEVHWAVGVSGISPFDAAREAAEVMRHHDPREIDEFEVYDVATRTAVAIDLISGSSRPLAWEQSSGTVPISPGQGRQDPEPPITAHARHQEEGDALAYDLVAAIHATLKAVFPHAAYARLSHDTVDDSIAVHAILAADGTTITDDFDDLPPVPASIVERYWGRIDPNEPGALDEVLTCAHRAGADFCDLPDLPNLDYPRSDVWEPCLILTPEPSQPLPDRPQPEPERRAADPQLTDADRARPHPTPGSEIPSRQGRLTAGPVRLRSTPPTQAVSQQPTDERRTRPPGKGPTRAAAQLRLRSLLRGTASGAADCRGCLEKVTLCHIRQSCRPPRMRSARDA